MGLHKSRLVVAAYLGLFLGTLAAAVALGQQEAPAPKAPELSTEAKVDRVFERWNRSDTPGCVVGVAVSGKPVLVKAYGMADLEAYAGTYYREEIDTTYTVYVEGGKLKVRFRPAQRFDLTPVYTDAFEEGGDVLRFTRDGSGRVDGFLVYAERVRHLRFVRKG